MEDASQSKPKATISEFSMLMVLCRDLAASRDFYKNVMGLRVANDQVPNWVDFDLGEGTKLGLHPEGTGRKVTPGTLQLGFLVPNVDKFVTFLTQPSAEQYFVGAGYESQYDFSTA